jgi:hypothetical protein
MIDKIVSEMVSNFRAQMQTVFTEGKGLAINRISREDAARLQSQAQAAKSAVDPTVAGLNAMGELVQAETKMIVAGLGYIGSSAEAFTQQVEAVADLSDVMVENSPRVQAALARMNQNVQALGSEYESIMFGADDTQSNQVITQAPQQKMLFAAR